MAKTIGIGKQDFGEIIENDCFYIDKTHFIKEWWESQDDVTLMNRPRRFGKTLTLNMLHYFFSIGHAGRSDLFAGLNIWKEKKFRGLQGTYPVIFLSFASVKGGDFQTVRKKICQVVVDLYSDFRYLQNAPQLGKEDVQFFNRVSTDMDLADATMSLNELCRYLYKYYGKKVIILLDEYDAPMQEAYVSGYWDEMASFIRELLNATFKTNPYLKKALMTGITRVSKESVFSDLNNLKVVTTTSRKYETAFGFTEEEVFQALEEYGLSGQKEEVKKWYDGFTFGDSKNIYNPWSITNYLDERKFSAYWANTSSNRLVSQLLIKSSTKMKQIMEDLLLGKAFYAMIDEEVVYSQLDDDEGAVWSLLLASGYLKITGASLNRRRETEYRLALTNYEVRQVFDRMVMGWFTKKEFTYNGFSDALLSNHLDYMNEYMNGITELTFSYFDTANYLSESRRPENFYHGFVLGLIADLREIYHITSNRESGLGRYDVLLEPKEEQYDAIIIEFKVFDPKKEKTLEDTVHNALRQIDEKRYAAALIGKGIQEGRIRKYGFAFQGKAALIGEG